MISTCSNIQKLHIRIVFQFFHIRFRPMSTIKHESITHIPISWKLEHYLQLVIWTISNIWRKNPLDKYLQIICVLGHLMNLCILSSKGMVQKKHVLDTSPRLFKVEPNGSPPIMTLHMNPFAQNGKWDCQPPCNNSHHLAFDLHIFHTFSTLGDSQDNDVIAWWYNIFVVTCNKHVPPCNNGISCNFSQINL